MSGGELGRTQRTPSQPFLPEQVIHPKYRLVRRLGEGGYGEVWVAHDLVLDVEVALKLLFDDPNDREARTRLLQEARAAAKLHHPAIVHVLEFGETTSGTPFIAMELLEGATLADVVTTRGRLAATHAVQVLLPIADALSAAHAAGIVHRDVKPDNIFLARDHMGRVFPKLLDFGIARLSLQQHITTDGMLLGTPAYMSPEQARGARGIDGRADVWGFAASLYEVVTGRPPFAADNYNALLQSILGDEPVPITEWGAGDEELWTLVAMGLTKDPEQRWQSMRTFGTVLARWLIARDVSEDATGSSLQRAWLDSHPSEPAPAASLPPVRPSEQRSLGAIASARKRRPAVAAALILLGALALTTLALSARRDEPAPVAATAYVAPVAPKATPAVALRTGAEPEKAAPRPPAPAPARRAPPPKRRVPPVATQPPRVDLGF